MKFNFKNRDKQKVDFAFIVHPRGLDDVYKKYKFAKFFPKKSVEFFLRHFHPVIVAKVTGVQKVLSSKELNGIIISCPITAKQMMNDRELAKKFIIQCVKLGEKMGAKVTGLGALTSSLVRGGLDVSEKTHSVITTGRMYTSKIIIDTTIAALDRLDLSRKVVKVSIVGAAGSIGTACAQLLARNNFSEIHLIDLSNKIERINKLKEILKNINNDIIVSNDTEINTTIDSDVIIAVTNKPNALITSNNVKTGAIIVDDAQPTDVDIDILKNRPDVLVLEGGVVNADCVDIKFDLGLKNKNEIYSCLAETIILALQDKCKGTPLGEIMILDIDILDKLESGAKQIGFKIGKFQNIFKTYSENDIQYIKNTIHKI